jgi:quinol monooxygenase YgiN
MRRIRRTPPQNYTDGVRRPGSLKWEDAMRLVLAMTALLAVFLLLGPAVAQEKEHPIETVVKANLTETSKPFTILIHVKIKDDARAKFEAAFAKARIETRKEKGNKAYDLSRSAKMPTEYIVYERWQNLAALRTHLDAEYITSFMAEIADYFETPPGLEVLLPAGE